MAGVAERPTFSEQLALVAGLRWNLVRNSLRTLKGRLELVTSLLLGVMMGIGSLGAGVGLGVLSYFLVSDGHLKFFSLIFWGIFLFWQLFPLLAAASTAQFDFANLLRFPLRFSAFYTLSLAYGFFDAPALMGMLWLALILLGASAARPALFLWGFPFVIVFAFVNVLLSRAIFAWLDRWLKQRRTREALVFIFILAMLSLQLVGPAMQRWERLGRPRQFDPGLAYRISRALPPGLMGEGFAAAAAGEPMNSASALALLAAYGGVFAWFLRIRLRAQYLGENLGETAAPAVTQAKGDAPIGVKQPWQLPFVPAPASAMFEKEARYLFRSGPMILQFIIPIIIMAPLLLALQHQGRPGRPATHFPTELLLPIAVGYAFLVQAQMVFNAFGFDGNGIQFLLMAPVQFSGILLGKNLFQGSVMLVEAALVTLVMILFVSPPGVLMVLATLTALAFASLANFSVGNLLSLAFPRRMEFAMMRQRRLSGITMIASLGSQVVLLGICGAILTACFFFKLTWIAPTFFLVLATAVLPLYKWSLRRADTLALDKREALTAELCKQE